MSLQGIQIESLVVKITKDIDETGYTNLEILETDKTKEKEMKEKFSKEYLRRLRLILRSKLNGRKKVMAVNTSEVSVMR